MNQLFQPKFGNQNPNAPKTPSGPQEKWAKAGFLNIELPDPTTETGWAKLDSIGFELSNPRHMKLLPWLLADNMAHFDERVKIVFGSARFTYRSAEKNEAAGFVLPGM